ncbi:MAG: hypothetical protein RR248_00275 [Clostridia bacterium]
MKILICGEKKKTSLHLPLSIVKTKFIIKLICKKTKLQEDIIDKKDILSILKPSLKELKKYKGLQIVEIISNDATIIITI